MPILQSFRLTIRNVNWVKENLYVVEFEGFRLTIRNVNHCAAELFEDYEEVLD